MSDALAAPQPGADRVVVLVGFMGAGKTTTGRMLAQRLGIPFVDSDHVVTQRTGRTIAEIFADDGEAAFRALEAEVIAELVAGPPVVLSVGGGAVETDATRAALAGVVVVHLHVSFRQALRRVGGDPRRPMLARPDIEQVYRRRDPLYRAVATFTVVTDGGSPTRAVEQIRASLPPQ
ncbi:MAG: Shikimate kinase [Jatrophihabitantaceae bacterium]|nr:Shikimate kinase [Jatrophihabitantaceae bacterium]